jgi:hypothetical protein
MGGSRCRNLSDELLKASEVVQNRLCYAPDPPALLPISPVSSRRNCSLQRDRGPVPVECVDEKPKGKEA